ncbi:HdeD family acid-resistance protein [Streptomyces sp. H39-S7]|uniref:HdeD family acid-resistance protein n=1 Tax=Streptomyces sp. H39-S7 TaxID=3004357 RepID=UPI0022AFE035|nr:HdeD family acid-resistance protein [Streptomyces sp. H39-S7]MCZ4125156.1 HdeD family acid-resistance protein [Streptomyces sp. H39-S7]
MTAPRDPAPPYDGPRPAAEGAASRPARGDPEDVLGRVGRSWIWILVSALVTLVPGILILVWPDETLHILAVLIGLCLLATGVFRFVSVFAHKEHGERLPGLLAAVLYVLAGVLCLRNPLQTIAALSLIVGTVWLVSGLLTLYTAIIAKDLAHRGVLLTVGILGIVAGVVVLALPAESAHALTRLLGLWLVLLGLADLVLALAWRAALNKAAADQPSRLGT